MAEIAAAHEWLNPEEDETSATILQIVAECLKDVKKLKTNHSIKMVTQLTAVTEYVKLRERFEGQNSCKRPRLNASLAVARRMGKGSYFARQTHHNEIYLLRHRHLPPTKAGAHCGPETLLDNETVLHNVRRYLAAQNLGAITPLQLRTHVNDVILPALDLSGKNSSICNCTAINWLKKLGYTCRDVKKGLYHDGHERPDVVTARQKFLEQMDQYSQ
jgi:hypothetical protein